MCDNPPIVKIKNHFVFQNQTNITYLGIRSVWSEVWAEPLQFDFIEYVGMIIVQKSIYIRIHFIVESV